MNERLTPKATAIMQGLKADYKERYGMEWSCISPLRLSAYHRRAKQLAAQYSYANLKLAINRMTDEYENGLIY